MVPYIEFGRVHDKAVKASIMSNGKRVYQVEYKMTFSGTVSDYEVVDTDGVVDLGKHFDQVQNDIIKQLTQLDYNDDELLYACERCGKFMDVFDGDKGKFRCDCTTETKRS